MADSAPNFGYLLEHEQLLVMYGATAEALVYTDPNTAMIKCRQFGEALTARAYIQFGIPKMPSKQFQRLKVLADQGFLNARVRSWFDAVRTIGNKRGRVHAVDALADAGVPSPAWARLASARWGERWGDDSFGRSGVRAFGRSGVRGRGGAMSR